jgi:hypothetical protein
MNIVKIPITAYLCTTQYPNVATNTHNVKKEEVAKKILIQ